MGQEQSTLQTNENNDNNNNNEEIKKDLSNTDKNINENKIEEKIIEDTSSKEISQKPNTLKINTNFENNGKSIASPQNDYKSPVLSVNSIRKSYRAKDFLSENIIDCLAELSSTTSYPLHHEIWKNLLKKEKIPLVNSRQCAFDMNIAINIIGTEIKKNNPITKNFTRLILILLSELSSCRGYKNDITIEIRNSLYLTRLLSKYFIENLSNEEIKELFDSNIEPNESTKDNPSETINNNNDNNMDDTSKQPSAIPEEIIIKKKPKLEFLIEELFNILILLPLTSENNLEFYEEVLNTFITFTASRYQNEIKNTDNFILTTIFKVLSKQENENLAGKVITKLLLNVIYSNDQKEGLLAKVLRKNTTYLNSIAKKSLYLFLILTNQPNQLAKNELSNLINEISNLQESGDIEIRSEIPSLKISFQSLYRFICEKINENEEICLLLYQLISQNISFRSFILSKIDPDLLLLPLLQTLYCSFKEKTNFNKIYTLVITLLIMSQDEIYTETLQRIEINNPSWFIDNNIKLISLSNFTLLILLKVIQINLGKYKDIYIHSNCLAILANLAIKMDNIHHYSAQKLIGLLDLVQKKYFKMKKLNAENLDDDEKEEKNMENKINEDLIMLLLEIINSCIINSLKTNLQLVYSVMRGKEIIIKLNEIEKFKEPIENISYTIDFFESKIVFEEDLPSSDEIMNQIIQISKSWEPSKLKKTEIIKFKFEEEKDYSLFFLPYIYNIIYSNTLMFVH